MKKLIIVNGTMGIGKSTVCKELYLQLNRSVWLDGDWCWLMNPWDFNDQNKKMVIDNITYILSNYINNPNFDYIVFSWVIHTEEIFKLILDKLKGLEFESYKISLICSEDELKRRMINGGRSYDSIPQSIARLKMYNELSTYKLDTTYKTVQQSVNEILEIINGK
ncbi:MAG: AAA family ATPase [Bacillota bacterium]|nr:AAA family ATPase [Bacillota bacterium]